MDMKLLRFADRRTARQSIVIGAVVALLVLVAGLVLAGVSKAQWTAESVSVVLPDPKLDAADQAAYYETLSRGQIVATFAEVASNARFQLQAEQNLGLDAAQQAEVTSTVTVAPSTSVVLIQVVSSDRLIAEKVAGEMTAVSQTYLQGLSQPYRLDVVNPGTDTAYRSSTSPAVLVVAALVVALVGGVAIQQAVYHSLVALRSGSRLVRPGASRPTAGGGEPEGPADPVDPAETSEPTPVPAEVSSEVDPADERSAAASSRTSNGSWWS